MDEIKKYAAQIAIDSFLRTPAGEWIATTVDTISKVQRNLFAISESEDGYQFSLLKIGTVFSIFLIDKLAGGKDIEQLDEDDWREIAEKVSEYAVFSDGQQYSEFVFGLYADYIDLSAKALIQRNVSREKAEDVSALAKEIRHKTRLLQVGEISEPDYVEDCLWLSLEAMIKSLSLSLTSVIGPEFAELTSAVSQLAFEYGRYVLYSKEQALLQEYIENQYILDEKLQKEYEDYLEEVNRTASQFQALVDEAFSTDLHAALVQSVALAKASGAREEELLKSIAEIDDFFQ